MICRRFWLRIGVALAVLSVLPAAAKNKKAAAGAADRIEVIGHVALPPGPAVNLVVANRARRHYLYVEHGPAGAVTVVDVTNARAPKATAELAPLPGGAPQHMGEVQGTAALFTTAQPASGAPVPDTVTIVSFEDPAHPRIVRQFSHVVCQRKDDARGLIYLINDEGLWVLRETPAPDRALEEDYDRYLRYNR